MTNGTIWPARWPFGCGPPPQVVPVGSASVPNAPTRRAIRPCRFLQAAGTLQSKGATAMDSQRETEHQAPERDAVVWIDHDRAIIVGRGPHGHSVQVVDRLPTEREARFEARAIDAIRDRDRVIVSGPAYARTGFERAYVAMTHRPDRLVDVQPTISILHVPAASSTYWPTSHGSPTGAAEARGRTGPMAPARGSFSPMPPARHRVQS